MSVTTDDLRDIDFLAADGTSTSLRAYDGTLVMIVNVASRCGLSPQYEQLEQLQRTYGDRGFAVLGFPCNQFMGQEPGSMEEILEYCAMSWGVTFPIFDKVKVNGPSAAPLYKALKKNGNVEGAKGPVAWNFEKFVLTPTGELHRFRPTVKPDDPAIVSVIEANLPSATA